eukprot:gene32046-36806_t
MTAALKEVDAALRLSGGPYFLGPSLSLVDILFVPFLERMAASLPYFKGFQSRSPAFPNLLRWYEAMDTRPTYAGIKSDYYTHCNDLPPQIGRCYSVPSSEPFRSRIAGGDWSLSATPEDSFEPMLPADVQVASREAARVLIDNHKAVTVSAPLADPNVPAFDAALPLIDSALRHVVFTVLNFEANQEAHFFN